jgi:hypothetical protein
MRGSRAKKLYRAAVSMVVGHMKKGASEGRNEYHQAMNRIEFEPQLGEDSLPMMDPEGFALMKPGKFPGTITCAWHVRTMYQSMKKQWKQRSTTT